jgi:hypothetical protein
MTMENLAAAVDRRSLREMHNLNFLSRLMGRRKPKCFLCRDWLARDVLHPT